MRPRQNTHLNVDLADRLRIAAVDARFAGNDAAAHHVLLGIMELRIDLRRSPGVAFTGRELGDTLLLELADLGVANLLLGDAVGFGDGGNELGDARGQRLVLGRRGPDDRGTGSFLRQRPNGFDGDLHLLVAEHHGAEHDVLGQPIGARFHHENGLLRAGNHEVELRLLQLRARRVEQVFAVLVADARGADRAHERQAGQAQCRGCAEQ